MSNTRFCTNCGAEIRAAAKFCHRCGTASDGSARLGSNGARTAGAQTVLPWVVTGIALLSLLAFVVGQNFRRPVSAPAGSEPAGSAPTASQVANAPGRAPDISQMSPTERADRLFQRVMVYVADGKTDSVQFFAPMAIQSQLALTPLDAHRRYDLGLLGMVSGDAIMARAQADTILAAQPDHLLGLILAMRTAGIQLDSTARGRFATRLMQVVARERAKGLPEYTDHEPDISAALLEAGNRGATAIR